jgi:hypothetical protein
LNQRFNNIAASAPEKWGAPRKSGGNCLATSKQAEVERTDALLADEYLADLVYTALLERGEPAKVSEITLEINNPRITFPVVRRILAESPRFMTVDRLWDLSARYLDKGRPTERNLIEVLEAAGKPLSLIELATELSVVYGRDSDIYIQLVGKVTKNENTYFKTKSNAFGLMSWLPLVDADEVEDILFDNNLTNARLEPYLAAAKKADWSPTRYAEATAQIVAEAKHPVPHRLLGVLAWLTMKEKYDPRKHILACLADANLVWLTSRSGGRWITRAEADRLEGILEARSIALAGEDQEEPAPVVVPEPELVVETAAPVVESVPEPVVETPVAEPTPAAPLNISDDDLKAIEQIIVDRGTPVEVGELLALQYEVVPGDPSFKTDVETLEQRLKSDDRFLYVGAGRFREPNSLPLFVYSIPEFLAFPDLQFVSMDGEIMDEEIEDEGFVGTLRSDVTNPLVQDAGDDEGQYTGAEPADTAALRLVLKAHHKDIGTFPLCQVPDGFFPNDAPVVEIAVRDPNGETQSVIVNHEQRLLFNLFGLYEFLPADSGAVFLLHRTARPFEFRFEPVAENDPLVEITPTRMSELLGLRENAEESGDVATFDIACEILAHYPKGLDFVQIMTEVNVVRRVTRRKLASILSNYYCFVQKPGQNLWRFDAKKRDLGTDRAKRKYIKR